jgi:hypothetical protein
MMSREFHIATEANPHEFVSVLTEAGVKPRHSTTYRADLVSGLLKSIHREQRPVDNQY